MLFNSFEFIFVFLPITLGLYFFLNHRGLYDIGRIWLILVSVIFYGWWNPSYLVLILASIVVNFTVAYNMANAQTHRKLLLWMGLVFNLGLLGYYKYANFFITNVNTVLSTDFNLLNIILPLGISFFTFSQIAYLVDTYKGIVKEFNILNYCLFVLFFPPLLSGPIVHHKEVMPQFEDRTSRHVNFENISKGLFLFNVGLAKKIIIADTFGEIVNRGYGNFESLSTLQSWITAFAYTVQLYFDFSGYSDMAIGIALMFNIVLPINFWSPHKAENIQQFYRRWHITLSRFLRDYVYIPLGGNKVSEARVNLNLFLTFLIGGLWHGANWTFVIWGAMNGAALVVHRLFQKTRIFIPHILAVLITFFFVMLVRIFFRSPEFATAISIMGKMFDFSGSTSGYSLVDSFYNVPLWIAGVVLLFMPNSNEIAERFRPSTRFAIMMVLMMFLNLTFLNSVAKQDFLYFDF